LKRDELERLHYRAMCWHESQGFTTPAIAHALAYGSTSGDLAHAERLIGLAAEETIHDGGVQTVRGWLDALPDAHVRANAELAMSRGWVLALSGDAALAQEYADAAEACLAQAQTTEGVGKVLALRTVIALGCQRYNEAIDVAGDALRMLPEDQPRWRILALWAMAESQERTRDISQAIATLREASRAGRALGDLIFAAAVEGFLASALNLNGQRREAVEVCEQALDRYADDPEHPSPVAGLIYSRLGILYYEANQLAQARTCLDQGLALCEQLSLNELLVFSQGALALTLHAQGESSAALDALHRARQLATEEGLSDVRWLAAWETDVRLRQGDLRHALRWAAERGLSVDDTPHYLGMDQHLAYSRLLLVQGRTLDARRWLARLERYAHDRGFRRWLITVHALQALAAESTGDHTGACERLVRALEIAAPEDYLRPLLDEGEQVIALLPGVRDVAPEFVDRLLETGDGVGQAGRRRVVIEVQDHKGAAIPGEATGSKSDPSQPETLIEPLSDRELEVLRLIAAGLSNREIAEELVIAVGTVKRHINHIYGKLGVHSRTQAVARAGELGLLD
jgi:LuxR family maltose regulon positive regulatory protein